MAPTIKATVPAAESLELVMTVFWGTRPRTEVPRALRLLCIGLEHTRFTTVQYFHKDAECKSNCAYLKSMLDSVEAACADAERRQQFEELLEQRCDSNPHTATHSHSRPHVATGWVTGGHTLASADTHWQTLAHTGTH
eukprot:6055942-Prymnesium_polylepis.1